MAAADKRSRQYKLLKPVIDSLSKVVLILGLSESCAHILATLYVFRDAMTLDELSSLTGYAKSTVSTCLNILERLRLVARNKVGRKYIYKPVSNPSDVITNTLREVLEQKVKPIIKMLEEMSKNEKLDPEIRSKLQELTKDVTNLAEMLERLSNTC